MTDEQIQKYEWEPGLPPGEYYPGMENDYEVYFSPIGAVWHRSAAKAEG
jgi:hypothetical protein